MNLSITLVQPESFFVQEGYDDIYLLRHVVLLEEDRAYYREYKLGMEVTIRNLLLLGCTRKQITRWATRPATAEEIDLLKDGLVSHAVIFMWSYLNLLTICVSFWTNPTSPALLYIKRYVQSRQE